LFPCKRTWTEQIRGHQDEKGFSPQTMNNQHDVTRFINIDNEDFTCHLNNQPIEFKAGEETIKPIFVAQHCAKHLIDRVLQKQNIRKYLAPDDPVRRSYMSKILPDLADEAGEKPLDKEQEKKEIDKRLDEQSKLIESLSAKKKDESDKMSKLEKENEELKKIVKDIQKQLKGQDNKK